MVQFSTGSAHGSEPSGSPQSILLVDRIVRARDRKGVAYRFPRCSAMKRKGRAFCFGRVLAESLFTLFAFELRPTRVVFGPVAPGNFR